MQTRGDVDFLKQSGDLIDKDRRHDHPRIHPENIRRFRTNVAARLPRSRWGGSSPGLQPGSGTGDVPASLKHSKCLIRRSRVRTCAGLGVLEAALLLMLPQVPPAKLLGAVLAYRAVFEILPLLVALALLLAFESTSSGGFIRRRLLRR